MSILSRFVVSAWALHVPRMSSQVGAQDSKQHWPFLISPAMTPPAHCASIINLSHAKGIWPLVASLEEAMQQGLRTTKKKAKHHQVPRVILTNVSTSTGPVAAPRWEKQGQRTADLVANYPAVNAKRKHLKFSHLCETWEVFCWSSTKSHKGGVIESYKWNIIWYNLHI